MYKKYFKYLKQIVLSDIGINGQDLLEKKKILCIGAGGLGAPALTYLTLAGIRNIDIIEFDKVDITNLNRQFIFTQSHINQKKILCAKNYVKTHNSIIKTKIYNTKLSYSNAIKLFNGYDIILDCTDNSESKMIISDSAIKLNIPIIHASVFGFEGYITLFHKNIFCYRCLCKNYKNIEHIEYGVIGAIAGILGCMQAIETIKLILEKKTLTTLKSKIILLDFKSLNIKILNIKKEKSCSIC